MYTGKNFDPNFKANQLKASQPKKDAVAKKLFKLKLVLQEAKRCKIVSIDGSEDFGPSGIGYPSRNAANIVLQYLIEQLPAKTDPSEPKKYWLVDL